MAGLFSCAEEVTRIARSWRHDRRRYRSGCLAVRSRDLKWSRFTINREFEQNKIPYGQPGLGRWIGPFRSVGIGKKRKRSHIIKWCQLSVVSCPLLNASACAWVGSRWRSSSTANYGQRTLLRCQLSPLIAAIQFRFGSLHRVAAGVGGGIEINQSSGIFRACEGGFNHTVRIERNPGQVAGFA